MCMPVCMFESCDSGCDVIDFNMASVTKLWNQGLCGCAPMCLWVCMVIPFFALGQHAVACSVYVACSCNLCVCVW